MSITVYYIFVTLMLAVLIAFCGGGFAYACRLRELDRVDGRDDAGGSGDGSTPN